MDAHSEECIKGLCDKKIDRMDKINRDKINRNRRARDQAMRDLGLVKVRGNLGGTYWE